MNINILTKEQVNFLELISKSELFSNYYLSGGTALVGYYYPYRYSDDLDFFTEVEIDNITILSFLKTNKNKIGYIEFDIKIINNRNLFFLNFADGYQLKVEFTYYPFTQIEKSIQHNNLKIDSIVDIAVNKIFTIYQNPRTRDFTDIYTILSDKKLNINDLISMAKIKFDWHVDKFQLGKRFRSFGADIDKPRYVVDFPIGKCRDFFTTESKRLGLSVIE